MRKSWLGLVAAVLALGAWPASFAQQTTRTVRVRYTFQPDCYRPSLTAPCDRRKTGQRLDLGPQIAVWVESADGKRFIDTLLVTNAVGFRGLGNRPGAWDLPSSPKFPYGKRPMALPVWAHARGKLYDAVVMQTGVDREYWLGFHEAISSPDPFYCRPMSYAEIDVDAVTCPTAVFNSAKGRYNRSVPRTYYPPRNDLRTFTERDCDVPNEQRPGCAMSARSFADVNDLDAVATPTPRYGEPFSRTWTVPADLPDGEYALLLEISKEFDQNEFYKHVAYTDPNLSDSGMKNNIGQPSVVFRVPFTLSRTTGYQGAATDIHGYGDWAGRNGTLNPPDRTITEAPGSGRGRLLVIPQPSILGSGAPVMGRLHVVTDAPPPVGPPPPPDAGAPPDASPDAGAPEPDAGAEAPPPVPGPPVCDPALVTARVGQLGVPAATLKAESAEVHFVEPSVPAFEAIEGYEVRTWEGDEEEPEPFHSGVPAESLSRMGPGRPRSFELRDLKADRPYVVGIRPIVVGCATPATSYARFRTSIREFTRLSGCFVATAAYGSPQARALDGLRRVRDQVREGSAFGAAAVALYERASPPLADLLAGSDDARALVRAALAPLVRGLEMPRP